MKLLATLLLLLISTSSFAISYNYRCTVSSGVVGDRDATRMKQFIIKKRNKYEHLVVRELNVGDYFLSAETSNGLIAQVKIETDNNDLILSKSDARYINSTDRTSVSLTCDICTMPNETSRTREGIYACISAGQKAVANRKWPHTLDLK